MALTDLELWCMGNPIEAAKRIDALQCALEAMLEEADRDGFPMWFHAQIKARLDDDPVKKLKGE